MSSSASPRTRTHAFHAFSVFEAGDPAGDPPGRNYAWRSVHSEISCSGVSGEDPAELPIVLTAYSGDADVLQPTEMYAVMCKLIATNNPSLDTFYHEAAHRIAVGPSKTFTGNLIDNTSVSSLGIVVSKSQEVEAQFNGKPTVVVIMRHSDYDPVTRNNAEFLVEYRCRPVRNLEKCQNLFHLGRETRVSGFIVDYRSATNMWVVDVYSIAICSGHENIRPTSTTPSSSEGGRPRLPRRTPTTPSNNSPAAVAKAPVMCTPSPGVSHASNLPGSTSAAAFDSVTSDADVNDHDSVEADPAPADPAPGRPSKRKEAEADDADIVKVDAVPERSSKRKSGK